MATPADLPNPGTPDPSVVSFDDGLGVRRIERDEATGDVVEKLYVSLSISKHAATLRERATRLANFRHPRYPRVRGVDVSDDGKSVAVICDPVEGVRLSDVIAQSEKGRLGIDVHAALQVGREVLPALATLHGSRDVTHGCVAAERLVLTRIGRVVVTDHTIGAAIEKLQYPRPRLWKDYRIAMPPVAGVPRFDTRADVAQVAVVILELILGRRLSHLEFPEALKKLVASVTERLGSHAQRPMSASLRAWFEQALPVDARKPLGTALDAQLALEDAIKRERAYAPDPGTLRHLATRAIELVPVRTLVVEPNAPAAPAPLRVVSTDAAAAPARRKTPARKPAAPRPTPEEEEADEIAFLERELARLAAEEQATPAAVAPAAAPLPVPAPVPLADPLADPLTFGSLDGEAVIEVISETPRFVASASAPEPRVAFEGLASEPVVELDIPVTLDDEPAWALTPCEPSRMAAVDADAADVTFIDRDTLWLDFGTMHVSRQVAAQAVGQATALGLAAPARARSVAHMVAGATAPVSIAACTTLGVIAGAARRYRDFVPADAPFVRARDLAAPSAPWMLAARSVLGNVAALAAAPVAAARPRVTRLARALTVLPFVPAVWRRHTPAVAALAADTLVSASAAALADVRPGDVIDFRMLEGDAADRFARAAVVLTSDAFRTLAMPVDAPSASIETQTVAADALAAVDAEPVVAVQVTLVDEVAADEEPVVAAAAVDVLIDETTTDVVASEQTAQVLDVPAVATADAPAITLDVEAYGAADTAEAPVQVTELASAIDHDASLTGQDPAADALVGLAPASADASSSPALVESEPVTDEAVACTASTPAADEQVIDLEVVGSTWPMADAASGADACIDLTMVVDDVERDELNDVLLSLQPQVPATFVEAEAAPAPQAPQAAEALAVDESDAEIAALLRELEALEAAEAAESARARQDAALARAAATQAALDPVVAPTPAPAVVEAQQPLDGEPREAADEPVAAAPPVIVAPVAPVEPVADTRPVACEPDAQGALAVPAPSPAVEPVADATRKAKRARTGGKKKSRRPVEVPAPAAPVPVVQVIAPVPAAPERVVVQVESAPLRQVAASAAAPIAAAIPAMPAAIPPAPRAVAVPPPSRAYAPWEVPDTVTGPVRDALQPSARSAFMDAPMPSVVVAPPPEPAASAPVVMPSVVPPPAPRMPTGPLFESPSFATGVHEVLAPAAAVFVGDEAEPVLEASRTKVHRFPVRFDTRKINWKRTLAASLLLMLLESVGFAAVYWFTQPTDIGYLNVRSSVDGLDVRIDGKASGKTPLAVELPAGRHTIEMSGFGLSKVLPVEIASGVQTTQMVNWPRGQKVGTLQVSSTPKGARVIIDGEMRGVAPVTIEGLAAGGHTLVLESESGRVRQGVRVVANEATEVSVGIFAGWLSVFAPVQVRVFEDGKLLGTSEDGKMLLPPGEHRIELVNVALGVSELRTVEVTPGNTTTLSLNAPDGSIVIDAPDGTEVWIDGQPRGTSPMAPLNAAVGTREVIMRHPQIGGQRRIMLQVGVKAPARAEYFKP